MTRLVWTICAACMLVGGNALAGPELVEFPADYKSTFTYVVTRDPHLGGNTVVDIFANEPAVESANGVDPLASGSIMVMEAYRAKLDANEEPVLDDNGRFMKDQLRGIVVMEKRSGWGEMYPAELRNGEWEYAVFTLEGERRDRPSTSCLECHGPLHELDYVYTFFDLADIRE